MADKKMDAIALLKADHREMEELLEAYEGARGKARKEKLAQEICRLLTVHTEIEEKIFYEACRGEIDDHKLDEGYVEHDAQRVLLAEIEAGGPDEEYFDTKVHVLGEMLEHHFEEEEKRVTGIFSRARHAGLDMDALGEQLATRRAELMTAYKKDGTPALEPVTFTEVKVA